MFTRLRSFLKSWFRRERFEDALDEEVRFHLKSWFRRERFEEAHVDHT